MIRNSLWYYQLYFMYATLSMAFSHSVRGLFLPAAPVGCSKTKQVVTSLAFRRRGRGVSSLSVAASQNANDERVFKGDPATKDVRQPRFTIFYNDVYEGKQVLSGLLCLYYMS